MTDSTENKKHPEPELTAKKMVPTEKYGLLKTWEFPDGTVIHINTKRGEENLRIYHTSGTYHEFRTNGTHVQFSSNNIVTYQKGGATLTWDNNFDMKGDGHARICISHDAHIECAKNASIACNGRTDVHSTGHIKLSAADVSLSTTEGSIVFAAERDIEFKAKGGRILMHSQNATQITTDQGDVHIESGADIIEKSPSGKHHVEAGNNVELKAGQDLKTQASQNITHDAGQSYQVGAKSYVEKTDSGSVIESTSFPPVGKVSNPVSSV